jgi:hypothetical protein
MPIACTRRQRAHGVSSSTRTRIRISSCNSWPGRGSTPRRSSCTRSTAISSMRWWRVSNGGSPSACRFTTVRCLSRSTPTRSGGESCVYRVYQVTPIHSRFYQERGVTRGRLAATLGTLVVGIAIGTMATGLLIAQQPAQPAPAAGRAASVHRRDRADRRGSSAQSCRRTSMRSRAASRCAADTWSRGRSRW